MRRDSIVQSNFDKGNYIINFASMPQTRVNHEVFYSIDKKKSKYLIKLSISFTDIPPKQYTGQ